ncbi:uncharacterized protein LOC135348476 [Halichondria panicea]|uniref:uncharacterized protein LOC135348476 n=1 Tax=Halichondria panicea TaxID=6063 RepID=UPI00312BCA91
MNFLIELYQKAFWRRPRGVQLGGQSTGASSVLVINNFKTYSITTASNGQDETLVTKREKKVMAAPVPLELGLLALQFQKIFWGMSYHDLSTIAFSVVVINGVMTHANPTVSDGRGTHAETLFIREANVLLMGQIQQGDNIAITINLSKSPCFMCREDLEDFLESLIKKGATVSFTLRIANLYFGDGGGRKQNIDDLVFWLFHLNENIVHTLIQPIKVVTEIPHYRPQGVSDDEWEKIQGKRRDKDTSIDTIVTTVDQLRAIAPRPVNTRRLFTNLTDVKETLEAREKRTFYKSSQSSIAAYVAVAQVQIIAVNTVGRSKEKIFGPIEAHGDGGCCDTLSRIDLHKKPQSWSILSKTIVLAVTHLPCRDCLANITRIPHDVVKPRLILRVANIIYEKTTVDWLLKCHREGLIVELQAINVTEELGQVNCEQNASPEKRQQWEDAKRQRQELDLEVRKNVQLINDEVWLSTVNSLKELSL